MGTFTPRGLGSIWLYFNAKSVSCNRNGSNYLAFQGIPLGGSGGPEKDRMFLVFVVVAFTLALLGFVWQAECLSA